MFFLDHFLKTNKNSLKQDIQYKILYNNIYYFIKFIHNININKFILIYIIYYIHELDFNQYTVPDCFVCNNLYTFIDYLIYNKTFDPFRQFMINLIYIKKLKKLISPRC